MVDDMQKSTRVPPYSNRGVLNTDQRDLIACLDWVSITFKKITEYEKIIEILGLKVTDFCKLNKSWFGYKQAVQFGHISILYEGNEDMGCLLEISGQGCREYESYNKLDWKELFIAALGEGDVNFPRLDVAIDEICYDETKPLFTPQVLRRKIKNGECVSKFWKGKFIEDLDLKGGKALGRTLYFGSDSSELKLRLYEKHFERLSKGYELDEKINAWNRFEAELRNDRARAVIYAILNDEPIGDVMKGILNQYLSFRVKQKGDSNRSRWPVAPFWDKYIGEVGKLQLTFLPAEPTIYEKKYHLEKQYSRTMAKLFLAFGNDFDQFVHMINFGMENFKEKDWEEIRLFQQSEDINYLDDVTFEDYSKKIETMQKVRDLFVQTPNQMMEQLKLF